jgi:hypothetical protein
MILATLHEDLLVEHSVHGDSRAKGSFEDLPFVSRSG